MTTLELSDWLTSPILWSATHGSQSRESLALRRRAASGELVRIRRGAYVTAVEWQAAGSRGRHLLRIRAVTAALASTCVVSHQSAVAAHGLPSVSDAVGRVQVTDPRRLTPQTTAGILRRPGQVPPSEVVELGPLRVTSLRRTAADMCVTGSFADAVLCVDAVLRRLVMPGAHRRDADVPALIDTIVGDLCRDLPPASSRSGKAARRALSFASPWAENGGESLVRIALYELGAPLPQLQVTFSDQHGFIGRCDFFFALLGVVLEFDGLDKYVDPEMLAGKTTRQAVRAEKRRDDRLSSLPEVRRVVHCDYGDVVEPFRLAEKLRAAGVPLDPRRVSAASELAKQRFSAR